jgi:hypothetical protein
MLCGRCSQLPTTQGLSHLSLLWAIDTANRFSSVRATRGVLLDHGLGLVL